MGEELRRPRTPRLDVAQAAGRAPRPARPERRQSGAGPDVSPDERFVRRAAEGLAQLGGAEADLLRVLSEVDREHRHP